jgi:hypothetical protein
MIVIAKGSISRPDALAPYLDDEMRVMRDLKAEGVIKSAYRRAAGPGFYFLRSLNPDTATAASPARSSTSANRNDS